ncbi:putative aspartic-type endopeptidase OPSB [Cyphellophora attinorum]|uniref:Putative aspartic-type endopeptidase OPSB n=1 Tax=Cyphellophora attinorum TaxID=1664694 RepID=A0A0N1P1S5_9EURO|nr:putative aspartic-type endopeptidase OPSB [Phialophora attinorum]KPI41215.1 putative aspartic-type endopeptidase OPSB [Phialophora attinorum]
MRLSVLLLSFIGVAVARDGFIKLDLHTNSRTRLRKRQTNTEDLDQQLVGDPSRTFYWLNITVGTPPQAIALDIDTGSSDLVVISSSVKACSDAGMCRGGAFDSAKSSTYQLILQNGSDVAYGDGTEFIGDLFTDVMSVGGIDIKKGALFAGLTNGLINGSITNDGIGTIGIGYRALSGITPLTEQANGTLPPTVVSAMVESGDIAREAYSLILGSQEANSGNVIFGGIDGSAYSGDLVALPVQPSPNEYANYTALQAALTGISVTDLDGTRLLTDEDFGVAALLDSGTTVTVLPASVAVALNRGFGVVEGVLPCSRAQANATITYHFGGPEGPSVKVPLSSLMDPLSSDASSQNTFSNGENACNFNVEAEHGSNGVVLGDSFMRSGYFVYDLENNQVAIAQAAASPASGGSITPIPSGTEIPGCSSTNTFMLPASNLASVPVPSDASASTESVSGSLLPATATFDLGAVTTQTVNQTPSGATASSSSSSTGAATKQTAVAKQAALGLAAVAVVGSVIYM